jgi:hypothetical protein
MDPPYITPAGFPFVVLTPGSSAGVLRGCFLFAVGSRQERSAWLDTRERDQREPPLR